MVTSTKANQLHNDQPQVIEDFTNKKENIPYTYMNKNQTPRVIQDFTGCTSITDATSANLTDINFLMEKYKPDELQLYLAARAQNRQQPIEGYDFTKEPDINTAMNEVARMKEAYQSLPYEVRQQFKNYVEFMKFADNPQNLQKLKDMGLITETKNDEPNDKKSTQQDPDTKTNPKTKKVTTTVVEET